MRRTILLLMLLTPSLGHAQSLRLELDAVVKLVGPRATHTLLVTEVLGNGEARDRTGEAKYASQNAQVARVEGPGRIEAVGDGKTTLTVQLGQEVRRVEVTVEGTTQPVDWHFENHILPLFSRHGCNSSGCHGKAEGQNGFKLSVFGFDPAADYAALLSEGRGRRLFLAAPEHSLLLRKATGQVPHGGGAKLRPEMADYVTLREWVAAGAPRGAAKAPLLLGLRVEPTARSLPPLARQHLRVWAKWNDGREVDVTGHARFQSNNEALATVDALGLVQTLDLPGEATILAAYRNQTAVFRAALPRAERIAEYPAVPVGNELDRHVWAKLKSLHVLPSDLCDDATFLRRVTLDILGVLPTPEETRQFLADTRTDRRARLVERLLDRPEYADYWAMKWADLLRVDRQVLGTKSAQAMQRWLRARINENTPLDQLAREVLLAEGPLSENPAGAFYKAVRKPGEMASHLSQVFLGVRIACAECHHHPYDRWSQTDYTGMSAFFSGVRYENAPGAEAIVGGPGGVGKHPRTGTDVRAHALGQTQPEAGETGDPRRRLAEWMTAKENPYFARNLANRMWAHFLGRGLVEPVDDVRATNPPTNPELLDALARHLIENRYDAKALIRAITTSRVYQLANKANPTNERDEQNHSRALLRRVPAEVLLDMLSQATGVAERFDGLPAGSRAVHLWDSKASHYFLKTFGRPARTTGCECERNGEPGVAQVLHLLNAPEIQAKLSHPGGRVARLVRSQPDDARLVEELYVAFYSRLPTDRERRVAVDFLRRQQVERKAAVEDLAWTLLNTLEFGLNH